MKYLKMLGLAAVAAMAFTAFAASSASATTLEVGGVTKNSSVELTGSLASGNSAVLSRTDGSLANTCTTSHLAGSTEEVKNGAGEVIEDFTGTKVTGALTTLTFESCTRPVTVHQKGQLFVEHTSGTNGTVSSENAEVTVSTPFGTVNCKTGTGTDVGNLTGTASGNATVHVNAVLNCGFLLPSASWKGTYQLTTPNVGVSA